MKDDLERKFEEAASKYKQGSVEWWSIKFKYDMLRAGERKEFDYRNAVVNSIVKNAKEIKKLQVSTFSHIKTERLVKIGAAMAVLRDELEKDNLIDINNNIARSK